MENRLNQVLEWQDVITKNSYGREWRVRVKFVREFHEIVAIKYISFLHDIHGAYPLKKSGDKDLEWHQTHISDLVKVDAVTWECKIIEPNLD